MDYTFRPVHEWPGTFTKAAHRKHGQFRASYQQTLDLLEKELSFLNARNVAIQVALGPEDIRLDGRPRSNAKRPAHPGVIVSCDTKQGPLMFPCDTYWEWKDNLRAVALSLEALRAVDRYGVTKRGEQYKGWAQLPPATPKAGTREEAASYLMGVARKAGVCASSLDAILSSGEVRDQVIRASRLASHPDSGGDTETFLKVQEAIETLRK